MKKKILIVEDEREMRALVSLSLEASGYDVVEASDGQEGMEKCTVIAPDLIILDLMLPGMGGYEVCERLKANKQLQHIPVLMFTARAGDIDRFMGMRCGAADYLPKPFDEEVLLDKVSNLLEGRSESHLN